MKYIEYSVNSGIDNMNIDEQLLISAIDNNFEEPVFRFYGWYPACISLGRNQKDDFVDRKFLETHNIDCVKRVTGGRALFHSNELTYCYVGKISSIEGGENIFKSYLFISQILINIFNELNIDLTVGGSPRHISKNNYCMTISTVADLCWNNRKFIGSAQCRRNGYLLQHGSILLDYDKNLIDKIFSNETNFDEIVTLKEINPNISTNDIIRTFKNLYL